MAVSDITTTVAPLAPVNTNVPVPHTLAGPSMAASKEFPPSFSGFQAQNFSVNPTMMRSQEQTMMDTFNNCQTSFIIGRSKRAPEISKRQPSEFSLHKCKGVKSILKHFLSSNLNDFKSACFVKVSI